MDADAQDEAALAARLLARVRQLTEDREAAAAFADRFPEVQRRSAKHDLRVKERHARLAQAMLQSALTPGFSLFNQLLEDVEEELEAEAGGAR
jgi:hypothetical protein